MMSLLIDGQFQASHLHGGRSLLPSPDASFSLLPLGSYTCFYFHLERPFYPAITSELLSILQNPSHIFTSTLAPLP